jgi:hypothetical protein
MILKNVKITSNTNREKDAVTLTGGPFGPGNPTGP